MHARQPSNAQWAADRADLRRAWRIPVNSSTRAARPRVPFGKASGAASRLGWSRRADLPPRRRIIDNGSLTRLYVCGVRTYVRADRKAKRATDRACEHRLRPTRRAAHAIRRTSLCTFHECARHRRGPVIRCVRFTAATESRHSAGHHGDRGNRSGLGKRRRHCARRPVARRQRGACAHGRARGVPVGDQRRAVDVANPPARVRATHAVGECGPMGRRRRCASCPRRGISTWSRNAKRQVQRSTRWLLLAAGAAHARSLHHARGSRARAPDPAHRHVAASAGSQDHARSAGRAELRR